MKEYKKLCKRMIGLKELVDMMSENMSDFDYSYTITINSPTTSSLEYDVTFSIEGVVEHLIIRANKDEGGVMFQLAYKDEGLNSLSNTLLMEEILDNERVFGIRKTLEKLVQFEKDNITEVTVGTEPLTISFTYDGVNYDMTIEFDGVADFIINANGVGEEYVGELISELDNVEYELREIEDRTHNLEARAIEIKDELDGLGINY